MSRVKRGVMHAKRRRYLLRNVKGFMWGRKSKITLAKTAAVKAGKFAYFHRKRKKRDFRALWQIRINAAARNAGTKYSTLIHSLKQKNITLDRKILATLAAEHPQIFKKITEVVK